MQHEAQLAILGLIWGAIFSDGDFVLAESIFVNSTVRQHPIFSELSDDAYEALESQLSEQFRQEFPNFEADGPKFRSVIDRMAFIDKRIEAVPAAEAHSIFSLVVGAAYADNRLTQREWEFLTWLGIKLNLSDADREAILKKAKNESDG